MKSKNGEYMIIIKEGKCTCPTTHYKYHVNICSASSKILAGLGMTFHLRVQKAHTTLDRELDMHINQGDVVVEHHDISPNNDNIPFVGHCSTLIPPHQTVSSKLLCLQKQIRDELAKCTAAYL